MWLASSIRYGVPVTTGTPPDTESQSYHTPIHFTYYAVLKLCRYPYGGINTKSPSHMILCDWWWGLSWASQHELIESYTFKIVNDYHYKQLQEGTISLFEFVKLVESATKSELLLRISLSSGILYKKWTTMSGRHQTKSWQLAGSLLPHHGASRTHCQRMRNACHSITSKTS